MRKRRDTKKLRERKGTWTKTKEMRKTNRYTKRRTTKRNEEMEKTQVYKEMQPNRSATDTEDADSSTGKRVT